MIQLINISKSFGAQIVLDNITLSIGKKEKIGLMGRNGYGKSTLIKIITGEIQPDEGEILIPKGYRIGQLSQHISFTKNTVLAEACLGLKNEEKEDIWRAEIILSGLGFTENDFQRNPNEFSGGYQIRINLAKTLLQKPDLLLLDEPTNYLDIVSLRWLERFLQRWNGEFLLVTHDRIFMDKVVTHTAALHRKKLRKVQGNTQKAREQIESEEEVYEQTRITHEKKKAKNEKFIREFRSGARSAGLVQSRIKMLSKLEIQKKLEKIPQIRFCFRSLPFYAGSMMMCRSLQFWYETEDNERCSLQEKKCIKNKNSSENDLLHKLDLDITPNSRIGIVGKNGAGKSTFLKLLAGKIEPKAGSIKRKGDAQIGYFSQTNVQNLDPEKTILEELRFGAEKASEQDIRNICASLLFTGNDVFKPIKVLSGGEKSRVNLGKILLRPVHVLLLDEPTNHLDMESCDALIHALTEFSGAVLVVSHNEDLLSKVTESVVVFDGGKTKKYEMGYATFLEEIGWTEEENEENILKKWKPKSSAKKEREEKKMRQKRLRQMEKRIKKLEEEIEETEKKNDKNTEELQEAAAENDCVRMRKFGEISEEFHKKINVYFSELEHLLQEKEELEKIEE